MSSQKWNTCSYGRTGTMVPPVIHRGDGKEPKCLGRACPLVKSRFASARNPICLICDAVSSAIGRLSDEQGCQQGS